jgi:hypothetical protein
MPNPDTPPSQATLRAFAQDPVIEGFWRAYWDHYLADGGDPERAEEVARVFRTKALPEMLQSPHEIIDMLVEGRLERLNHERASRAVAEIRLVERIETAWGEGLALLDAMISFAEELLEFVRRRVKGGIPDEDWTRAALLLILARGIQTSWEVRTLLRNGYASGAWARWRTLHELSVLAKLIGKHGDAVAQAYLAHDEVQTLRTIKAFEKSSATPETWAAHRKVQEKRVGELEAKYGKELFKRDYGWAGLAFPNMRFKYPKPALTTWKTKSGSPACVDSGRRPITRSMREPAGTSTIRVTPSGRLRGCLRALPRSASIRRPRGPPSRSPRWPGHFSVLTRSPRKP